MSVGYVAGTEKFKPFEMAHYRTPVADDVWYRIKVGNDMNKVERKNFADLEAKRLSYVPGPSKYIQ